MKDDPTIVPARHETAPSVYSWQTYIAAAAILAVLAVLVQVLKTVQAPSIRSMQTKGASVSTSTLAELGPSPAPTPYVSNAGGIITAFDGSTLVISTYSASSSSPNTMRLSVGSDTDIFAVKMKGQATIQAALKAYWAAHPGLDPNQADPPAPYDKQELASKDLVPGMLVNVKVAEQKDSDGTLHALEVRVLSNGESH